VSELGKLGFVPPECDADSDDDSDVDGVGSKGVMEGEEIDAGVEVALVLAGLCLIQKHVKECSKLVDWMGSLINALRAVHTV
jgi:hypothetical protein